MKLTGSFNLTAKSKQELRGLYSTVYNKIADPKISMSDRQNGLCLLRLIRQHLNMRP